MKRLFLLQIIFVVCHLWAVAQHVKTTSESSSGGSEFEKRLNILTIGDSNGAANYGWPQQLKKLLPNSMIINKSISGNTIGFDNLDQAQLNTVKNIDRYLEEAYCELGQHNTFDYILIGLGTNDAKQIFLDRQKEVGENMSLIIQKIRQFMSIHGKMNAAICIITPPPMDEKKVNKEKYGGGDKRIKRINQQLKKVAIKNQIGFVDTYTSLKKGFSDKTEDGVHLNERTQLQMAKEIIAYLFHY